MKNIKNSEQIEIMKRAGKILGEVLDFTLKAIKPGVSELELDQIADELILRKGGFPGFKKVEGYKHATCICTNDVVVHGIPSNRKLKDGDVVCIDSGVYLDGFHTDMAETILVKTQNSKLKNQNEKEIEKFLKTGKSALWVGIKEAKPGNRVGHISKAIQEIVEGSGYSVVRPLVGHGVGRNLHEDPQIPGRLEEKLDQTPKLETGMTIAIEVIYNLGKHEVEYEGSDDWAIVTADHSLSAVFERTIVITDKGPEFITAFPGETIQRKELS
jgi:methionyl aminopeptidase